MDGQRIAPGYRCRSGRGAVLLDDPRAPATGRPETAAVADRSRPAIDTSSDLCAPTRLLVVGLGSRPARRWLTPEASDALASRGPCRRIRAVRGPGAGASRPATACDRQHCGDRSRPVRSRSGAGRRAGCRGLRWRRRGLRHGVGGVRGRSRRPICTPYRSGYCPVYRGAGGRGPGRCTARWRFRGDVACPTGSSRGR